MPKIDFIMFNIYRLKNIYKLKIVILFLVIFSIILLFRTYNFHNEFVSPDEMIVVFMVENMYESNSFDTNWANAKNMPDQFRYDQYNFSSYILSTYLYYKLFRFISDDNTVWNFESNIKVIRTYTLILSIFSGVLLYLIATRVGGLKIALLSLLLYAITPILVQDSLYARPETFVTFFTLFVVYLSLINNKQSKFLIFISSFFLGILISAKITMVLLLFIPFLPLLKGICGRASGQGYKGISTEILEACAIIVSGVLSGLVIGMPYAFVNFDAFLSGLNYLKDQYSSGHYPHGPANNDSLFILKRTIFYFYYSLGAAVVICFFAGCFAIMKKKKLKLIYVLILPVASIFLFFMFQNVFFERNFSHVIPLILIITALGFLYILKIITTIFEKIASFRFLSHMTVSIAALALIIVPLNNSYKLYFLIIPGFEFDSLINYENELMREYSASIIVDFDELSEQRVYVNDIIRTEPIYEYEKVIIRIIDYRDNITELITREAAKAHCAIYIGRHESILKNIPICTLHTYHTPSYIYYLKEPSKEYLEFITADYVNIIHNDWAKEAFPVAIKKAGLVSDMHVYSSWVYSDESVGIISFDFDFKNGELCFPYLTGPVSDNQKINIFKTDDKDYIKIFESSIPPSVHQWSFLIIDLDIINSSKIRIEFLDNGVGWGEWSAIAIAAE